MLAVFALAIQLTCLGCVESDPKVEAAPAESRLLRCAEPVWRLGLVQVKGGFQELEHEFKIMNRSGSSIRISKVTSSCGCLVAEFPDKDLDPGEECALNVTFTIGGAPGAFARSVTVYAESPESSDVDLLTVSVVGQCSVSPLLYSAPQLLDFGRVAIGENRSRELLIGRYDGSALALREVTSSSERLRWTGDPIRMDRATIANPQGESYRISIELNAMGADPGPFTAVLKVLTESTQPESAELAVAVRGEFVPSAGPYVERLFVGRLGPSDSVDLPVLRSTSPDTGVSEFEIEYRGDDAITIERSPASSKSGVVRISNTTSNGGGRVARGVLEVKSHALGDVEIPVIVYLGQ